MHILSVALKNDIQLLMDYIELDTEMLDVMTYNDFMIIFKTCDTEISNIVYETYGSSDECHAAAIVYMKNRDKLNKKRLVDISNIPKEDLKDIITSNLAVFSTYHLIDDIPLEYIDLINTDIVDTDELVFILPLSSREEIVEILNRNPSLSTLFGPYLSCTVSHENLSILREHDRIVEVGYPEDNDREIILEDQEETPLEIYLKTGEGKDDIIPEYEDTICLETLEDIEKIHSLGYDIYNKLDISLDIDIRHIPSTHLKLLNNFKTIDRCICNVDIKDAIDWFKYIDNAEVDGFLNYSTNRFIESKEDIQTLQLIWSKYHDDIQLNKIVLSLLPQDYFHLNPIPNHNYLRFM